MQNAGSGIRFRDCVDTRCKTGFLEVLLRVFGSRSTGSCIYTGEFIVVPACRLDTADRGVLRHDDARRCRSSASLATWNVHGSNATPAEERGFSREPRLCKRTLRALCCDTHSSLQRQHLKAMRLAPASALQWLHGMNATPNSRGQKRSPQSFRMLTEFRVQCR
jgi:hypothetical protein